MGRPRGRNELLLRCGLQSALTLLVARVVTNDHDPAVPTDNAALVADLLHARLDLHGSPSRLLVAVDDASPG
jgi:hypothetical protein